MIDDEACALLAERLATPLQVAEHLDRAFTDAFTLGASCVTAEIAAGTFPDGFDALDARLARIGYTPAVLAAQFDARPAEIRRFLNGKLEAERSLELSTAMRGAGLPV